MERDRRLLLLALGGVVATLVGVFSTWASGDAHTLNGVQGPQNGWLAVIYALIGAAAVRAVSRRSWLGIIATLLVSAVVLVTVVDNQGVPGFGNGWGFWMTLTGGALLAAAGLIALGWRLTTRERRKRAAAATV